MGYADGWSAGYRTGHHNARTMCAPSHAATQAVLTAYQSLRHNEAHRPLLTALATQAPELFHALAELVDSDERDERVRMTDPFDTPAVLD